MERVVLMRAVLMRTLWVWVIGCLWAVGVATAATSLPGTEITPEEMQRAFPKPLERRAPHMPFSPGPAPLLPEAAPMRVPEPATPKLTAPAAQGGTQTGSTPSGTKQFGATPLSPRQEGQNSSAPARRGAASPASAAPVVPGMSQPQGQGMTAPPEKSPTDAGGAGTSPLPSAQQAAPKAATQMNQASVDNPSVEMMVGQMLMVGFSHAELKNNAPVLDLAARGVIGGVLLMPRDARGPRNIISPAQVRVLTATLQKAAREGQGSGGVPLFLAVEQEGGMAQALDPKLGFEGGTAAAKLGRGSVEATSTAARRMGLEMAALGLNFNFAPVADVNVNPLSEEIGKKFRSFSPNPEQAAAHVVAFGQGMAAAGIAPCLKYFPGTGSLASSGFSSTAGAAHFGPPDLAGRWQMLELTPFREALSQNWPGAVQPALAYHRGLDALYPATLSGRMLTDILRTQLGFSGVIVSNDLEALERFYPLEEALLLAVRAGADILLLPARQGIAPAAQPQGVPGMPNLQALQDLANMQGLPDLQGQEGAEDMSALGALSGGGLAGMLSASGLLGGKGGAPVKTGLVSPNVTRAHAALVQMVRDGRISQERLRLSWHRIMKLKKHFAYPQSFRTNP